MNFHLMTLRIMLTKKNYYSLQYLLTTCFYFQNEIHLIKKDDKVGASEATLLNMLNVSPFTYGLKIRQVYDSGTVFSPEILDITSEDLRAKFMEVSFLIFILLYIIFPVL